MPSGYSREGITALINDRIEKKIESSTVRLHPLLNFLAATEADNSPYNQLGRPDVAQVYGSASMSRARRESEMLSLNRHFRVTKFESEDATGMTHGGNTPTAITRADENVGTFEMRVTHIMKEVELNKHVLERMANQATVVGKAVAAQQMANYIDDIQAEPWERFCQAVHTRMYTGTLTAAEQDSPTWSNFLGLQHTLTAGNTYGRVNRASVSGLTPNALDATLEFNSAAPALEMIKRVNSGFNKVSDGSKFLGLKHRSGDGTGATCWITTPAIWQELSDQIESRYLIQVSDLPKHGLGGFKYDCIFYQGAYIVSDHECPDGEMYGLNMDSWLLEIDPRHNMRFLGLNDESMTVRGGGYINWGHYSLQARLTCRLPWTNVRIFNVAA